MPLRDADPTALAARRSAVTARHGGGGRSLVEEDEAVGIEVVLSLETVLALDLYVGAILLGGMRRDYLRVIP